MNVEIMLAGVLFYVIIVSNLLADRFGYQTISDLNASAKLADVQGNYMRFRISIALIVFEHVSIILLSLSLFFAFSATSLYLALSWTLVRASEGSIQLFGKLQYSKILAIAKEHSVSSAQEKVQLERATKQILTTNNNTFFWAQILFSIGTFLYTWFFLNHDVIAYWACYLGLAASVVYGTANILMLFRPGMRQIWNIGGGLIFVYESLLGGMLIYASFQ